MKTNFEKQSVKILGFALVALGISFQAKAQNTTTAIANLGVIKNTDLTSPRADSTVRLVDNKGTIKYLQVKNGLTAITNKATDGTGVTTTWQLGGALTDSTFIDVNGKAFVLNGIPLLTPTLLGAGAPSINAIDKSSNGGAGTGWTVLIRDEATGATQKIMASDLLQVQAGQNVVTLSNPLPAPYEYNIAANAPNLIQKISVYRNGAKLVAVTDYTYDFTAATGSTAASGKVTLVPNTGATNPNAEWALYVGDVIEIQWVK
jgi:hypothetical protein